MAKARLSSSELARLTGLPATTIKRIRNNEQSNPTISTLLPISKYFSISLSQLVGDEELKTINNSYNKTELQRIPLLSWQECFAYTGAEDEQPSAVVNTIFTEKQMSKKAFALCIEDQDLDFFPKRSIVLIEPEKTPESGDYIVVAKTEQRLASIKKYIAEFDQIYLKSLVAGLGISALTSEYKILGVILQCKIELKNNIP